MQHLPNAIFALIPPEQRRALMSSMLGHNVSLICKSIASENLFTLHPVGFEGDRFLVCEAQGDPIPVTGAEKVIVSFDFKNEKYFMQSSIMPGNEAQWKMEAKNDVFKLQRRQSFRINIPPTYRSKAIFRNAKTGEDICQGVLTDISSGGCKVIVNGNSFLISQQEPMIEVSIGKRDPINLLCEVRHVRKIQQPKIQDSLGIMFKSVNSLLEAKLFAITMELHRELTGKIGNS